MPVSIVLIDANNFYASCEQFLDPSIQKKSVVVLSNNDGCIISRNAEARRLGIKMGQPYFKIKKDLETLKVEVRSSNYELYGDISSRMMRILRDYCENLEPYSIDEAFATITRTKDHNIHKWAQRLRSIVLQYIGISISIGIGSNKVQSKIANYLAKKYSGNAGIFDLEEIKDKSKILQSIKLKEIWGIGSKTASLLTKEGVTNAKQLRDTETYNINRRLGIKGLKLQYELQGFSCLPLNSSRKERKRIIVSRSFSAAITKQRQLKEAICYYIILASQKLRRYNLKTSLVFIYTRTSIYQENYYEKKIKIRLDYPSNNTQEILKKVLPNINKLNENNYVLSKAGVIMEKLRSSNYEQLNLFIGSDKKNTVKNTSLIKVIDKINHRFGKNTITWCASGIKQEWKMKRNKLSMNNTTNIRYLAIVWAK